MISLISPGAAPSLFVPRSLNLKQIFKDHPDDKWKTPKAQQKLAYVVHSLLEQLHGDKRASEHGDYVPLNVDHLRTVIHHRFASNALKALQSVGVLECSPKGYSAGRVSRRYRLNPFLRTSPLKAVPLSDRTLIGKLARTDDVLSQKAIGEHAVRRAVWENLHRVSINPKVATLLRGSRDLTHGQRLSMQFSLRDVGQSRHWIRADGKTGRLFHSVSQCPKKLRPHLLIDGEPTAEVDLRNSQFYFLQSLYTSHAPEAERATYANAVCGGQFYETLFAALTDSEKTRWMASPRGACPALWDRDSFKECAIAHCLYSTNTDNLVFNAFRRQWPWLGEALKEHRQTKAGASQLALDMQRLEADLILGKVLPQIANTKAAYAAIPIHDAILCASGFAEEARSTLIAEGFKTGLNAPAVSIKVNPAYCLSDYQLTAASLTIRGQPLGLQESNRPWKRGCRWPPQYWAAVRTGKIEANG